MDDPKEFNETVNNSIQRAQAIINEMNLNMAEGGEFAARMRGLYDYFDRRLQESNMTKRDEGILAVTKRITVLRDAWSEMLYKGIAPGNADNQSRSEMSLPSGGTFKP